MNGRLVRREQVTKAEQCAMFSLMEEYFDGVTPELFLCDLAEKNWIVLLEEAGRIRGFTTLLVQEGVAHSGDTIVHRDAWGSSVLARTWLEAIRKLRPQYWLLITSGFRTYRFLPVFWKEFWPRHDAVERPALLEALARQRYGCRYADGIVRFQHPQLLRQGLSDVPPGRFGNPHVDFFVRANPRHAHGDELVCLCPLSAENQTAAGRKVLAL